MVCRGEHLVKVFFFEQGFLRLETFFAEQRVKDGVCSDRLVREVLAVLFLEQNEVRVEEPEAYPVTGESPVALGRNCLFEKREVEQDVALAVCGSVFDCGERKRVLEAFPKKDVFDGETL